MCVRACMCESISVAAGVHDNVSFIVVARCSSNLLLATAMEPAEVSGANSRFTKALLRPALHASVSPFVECSTLEASVPCSVLWYLPNTVRTPVAQAPRACVVGENYYDVAKHRLRKSANDACDVAQLLFESGYAVDMCINTTSADLLSFLQSFASTQSSSGLNVVYVSGHGFQHGDDNLLLPIDFNGIGTSPLGHLDVTRMIFRLSRLLRGCR